MKPSIAILVVAAACFASNAAAINPCSDVDVAVSNNHPSKDPIKIVYLKYQVNGGGSWYKEDLADKTPNNGNSSSWADQDLQDMPEGSGGKFRVHFKRQLTSGLVPTYGDTYYLELDRDGANKCTDGRLYTFDINASGTKGE